MTTEILIELMGYAASAVVLVSLLMTSVVKLRIFNSLGAAIYVVYGVIIGSYPTAVMNLCLIAVNVYFLVKLQKNKAVFHVCAAGAGESGLNHFLHYHRNDIHNFFPDWDFQVDEADSIYVVYAETDPVGVLIGRREQDTLHLRLDYTTARYRDCSVGHFLYPELKNEGICRLVFSSPSASHAGYLKKMAFVETQGVFEKTL